MKGGQQKQACIKQLLRIGASYILRWSSFVLPSPRRLGLPAIPCLIIVDGPESAVWGEVSDSKNDGRTSLHLLKAPASNRLGNPRHQIWRNKGVSLVVSHTNIRFPRSCPGLTAITSILHKRADLTAPGGCLLWEEGRG